MQYESQFSQPLCLFRFDFESEFSYSFSFFYITCGFEWQKKASLVSVLNEVAFLGHSRSRSKSV